jgi:hypothetical protein
VNCKKYGIEVTGCSNWTGDDPMEICSKCGEIGSLEGSNGKTHVIGQVQQLPPIKHCYSAIKHRSKGVILISTKRVLPHLGERGGSCGE